jgi:hypothetical protein
MLESGLVIQDVGEMTFPSRVRYAGNVERACAFLSRQAQATSRSSLKREPMSQFGVDQLDGQPAQGEG